MLDKNFIASEIIPQEPGSTVRVRMHGKERRVELLRTEVDRVFLGGEESPLRWWCDGLRPLAALLTSQGFTTSAPNPSSVGFASAKVPAGTGTACGSQTCTRIAC